MDGSEFTVVAGWKFDCPLCPTGTPPAPAFDSDDITVGDVFDCGNGHQIRVTGRREVSAHTALDVEAVWPGKQ